MNKTIDITEYGSNRNLTLIISNILYVEALTYNSGPTVTVITMIENKTVHAIEKVDYIKSLINRS
jgi:hypothetical protein